MSKLKDQMIDEKNEADLTQGRKQPTPLEKDIGIAVCPVPKNIAPEIPIHPKLGKAIAVWDYRDKDGLILMRVARFNGPDGKEDRPVTYRYYKKGVYNWAFKSLDKPRPLYGLDRLAARPEGAVIICEGEKATDAASKLFPDYIAVTSSNGANSARSTDWQPLAGRDVIIWPDNDIPGRGYAAGVAEILEGLAATIKVVKIPEGLPQGWDLADSVPAGMDVQLDELLAGAKKASLDPLSEILDRVGENPANAFAPDIIDKLNTLYQADRSAYEKIRIELRARNVRVVEVEKMMQRERKESGGSEPSQADLLLDLAENLVVYHTDSNTAFCDATVNGRRETYPVRSRQLRQYLTRLYYESYESAPSTESLNAVVNVVEARALYDSPERPVFLRVGDHKGKYYLDPSREGWRVIEIDGNGWRMTGEAPVRFRRSSGMLSLPAPKKNGSVWPLRKFLNVQDDSDFVLVVAWILAALRSTGPYPLMVISGEQGSAKSTFASLLRKIVDPNSAGLRTLPREVRDLYIAANNGHVLAFDNLSYLSGWLSDALCRLSTGGGFATRQLHTDMDEVLFSSMRPVILNGIDDVITRPDLADRSILLTLEPIPEEKRRTERELMAEFENELPGILGGLLDIMVYGLKMLPHIKLESLPRMADFALWVTACEQALWPKGTFQEAYNDNFASTVDNVLEASDVATAILSFMELETEWSGTAGDLLAACEEEVTETIRKGKSWPRSPRAMSSHVRRAATFLRKAGIHVETSRANNRNRTRVITISRSGNEGGNPSLPSDPRQDVDFKHAAQRTEMLETGIEETVTKGQKPNSDCKDGSDELDPELHYESDYKD